jgi:hypothetical protein
LYEQAAAKGNSDGTETAEQQRALALAEAVHALKSLGNKEARGRLNDHERKRTGNIVLIQHGHEPTFLSHFEPTFWTCAFADLFPYDDCHEKYPHVHQSIKLRKLANVLTCRAVFLRWRESLEYCGVVYNLCVSRAHMYNIHKFTMTNKWFQRTAADLETLGADEWIEQALRCGECYNVRDALRRKGLDDRVRTLLSQMQVASRDVEGSAAARSALRFRFVATRVWCGCAFVFFTLNPHDNKTPLLIVFGHGERFGFRRLSLDWDDAEMTRYYDAEKEGNALRFHDFAANHPRACSRAVHETFRMVLEILGNTAPPANVPGGTQHLDLIAAKCEAGMWQYVHAYNGTVEPQARTTEHMHAFFKSSATRLLSNSFLEVILRLCTGVALKGGNGNVWRNRKAYVSGFCCASFLTWFFTASWWVCSLPTRGLIVSQTFVHLFCLLVSYMVQSFGRLWCVST